MYEDCMNKKKFFDYQSTYHVGFCSHEVLSLIVKCIGAEKVISKMTKSNDVEDMKEKIMNKRNANIFLFFLFTQDAKQFIYQLQVSQDLNFITL